MRYVWVFIATVFVTNLVAFLSYVFFPSYRIYFIREDSFIENVTAIIFCCAFLLASIQIIQTRPRRRDPSERWWLVVIAALGLLAFLDEISFGERLFNLKMPTIAGVKIDGAHDFIELLYYNASGLTSAHPGLFYFVAACVLLLLIIFLLRLGRSVFALGDRLPIVLLLACFAVFVISATMIDAIGVKPLAEAIGLHRRHIMAVEEMLELNAALALMASALVFPPVESLRCASVHKNHPTFDGAEPK